MNILSFMPLPVRALALLIVMGAVLAGLAWWHHDGVVQGRAEVQAKWDAHEKVVAADNAKKLDDVKAKTTDLQAKTDKERGTLNAHIRSIDLERDELLRRLRTRPARPTESAGSVSANSGPGPSCTGAGLYAPDGEFLAREAARADAIRARLATCESAYKRAQSAVNSAVPAP